MQIGRVARILLVGLFSLGLPGAACDSDRDSATIATSEMTARFVARANASGVTKIVAELLVPGDLVLENVDLNGGDRLIARRIAAGSGDARERVMVEKDDLVDTEYGANFQTGERDTRIEIDFDRTASGQADAIGSSVTLPSPFALQWVSDPVAMTPAPRFFSRSTATPYYVVWDPFGAPDFEPGDELDYAVTGTCIQTLSGTIDWAGGEDALELTAALEDANPPQDGRSCPIRVEFTLSRSGAISPAFDGGSIVGAQGRVLKLQTVP